MEADMNRSIHFGRVTLMAVAAVLVIGASTAHAGPRFYFSIGVPVPVAPVVVAPPVVPPPPPVAYGMVWRPGYYNWNGYAYGWVPGAYVRPPYTRTVWVGPRWVHHPRGVYWTRGYWRR
jgi:hypothetical protein